MHCEPLRAHFTHLVVQFLKFSGRIIVKLETVDVEDRLRGACGAWIGCRDWLFAASATSAALCHEREVQTRHSIVISNSSSTTPATFRKSSASWITLYPLLPHKP